MSVKMESRATYHPHPTTISKGHSDLVRQVLKTCMVCNVMCMHPSDSPGHFRFTHRKPTIGVECAYPLTSSIVHKLEDVMISITVHARRNIAQYPDGAYVALAVQLETHHIVSRQSDHHRVQISNCHAGRRFCSIRSLSRPTGRSIARPIVSAHGVHIGYIQRLVNL